MLELITGKSKDNTDIYAYMLFNKQSFEEKKHEFSADFVNLSEHGILILQGVGQPSAESDAQAQKIFQEQYLG